MYSAYILLLVSPFAQVDGFDIVLVSKGQNISYVAKGSTQFSQNSDNKKRFKGPNPNLKCSHCNKDGHEAHRCFELIGYPSYYKTRGSIGSKAGSVNNSVNNKSGGGVYSSLSSLTADQVARLLSLINDQPGEGSQSSTIAGNSCPHFSCSSVARRIYAFACDSGVLNGTGWVVDSGANQHMVKSDECMINLC